MSSKAKSGAVDPTRMRLKSVRATSIGGRVGVGGGVGCVGNCFVSELTSADLLELSQPVIHERTIKIQNRIVNFFVILFLINNFYLDACA